MSPYLVHCNACCRTYDGNAQCCIDMDHVRVESFADHMEEIRGFVKSNPELLRRLDAVEKIHEEEILTNEELQNDLNQAHFDLNAEFGTKEEINGDVTRQLSSIINRLETENNKLKKQKMRAPAEEYYAKILK